MRQFIDAGRAAIEQKNYQAGLTLALTMPDICGSIETPDAGNGTRYRQWAVDWFEPIVTRKIGAQSIPKIFITADELWNARNSIVHSGKSEMRSKVNQLQNILFFDDSTSNHLNTFNVGGHVFLQVKTSMFCDSMWQAVENWMEAKSGDEEIGAAVSSLLTIRTAGYKTHGIQFS